VTAAADMVEPLSDQPKTPLASDRLLQFAALAYLVLLPLNVPLWGPLFLHDALAPAFGLALLGGGRLRRFLRPPGALLTAFLGLALLATLWRLRGLGDLYEPAIFVYMAVLFGFFRSVRIERRWLLRWALATLLVFCGFAAGEALLGVRDSYATYEGTTLDFIAERFFFTFSHPNLVGSFYVLPVLCLLLPQVGRTEAFGRRDWALRGLVLTALCAPLALTVSRHMLLSFALVLAFAVHAAPASRRKLAVALACAALFAVFALFYVTIVFPFFPLRRAFPFFNHDTLGMYMIHQKIYFRMPFQDLGAFLAGLGRSGVRAVYPTLADWDSAYAVLAQYKQESLTQTYVTYMDAHNEYLNLAATFGVPAMLCCAAFWVAIVRSVKRSAPARTLLVFYVAAVAMVAFWDDILSKRWIWAALGILVNQADGSDRQQQDGPDGSQLRVPVPE